jgi:hypothetical protein
VVVVPQKVLGHVLAQVVLVEVVQEADRQVQQPQALGIYPTDKTVYLTPVEVVAANLLVT